MEQEQQVRMLKQLIKQSELTTAQLKDLAAELEEHRHKSFERHHKFQGQQEHANGSHN